MTGRARLELGLGLGLGLWLGTGLGAVKSLIWHSLLQPAPSKLEGPSFTGVALINL